MKITEQTIKGLQNKLPEAFEKKEPPIFPPRPNFQRKEFRKEKLPDISNTTIDLDNPLAEPDAELEKEIHQLGTDALAWYRPFHFYDDWGIFIRQRGLLQAARLISTKLGVSANVFQLASKILRDHEVFHFLSEWAATFFELHSSQPKYKIYASHAAQEDNHETEEMLANAYAYRQIEYSELEAIVAEVFSKQPRGYRDYEMVVRDEYYLIGKRALGRVIESGSGVSNKCLILTDLLMVRLDAPNFDEPPFELIFGESDTILVEEIPTYLVIELEHPSSTLQFRTTYKGAEVAAFSSDHCPPHIHVWIPPHSRNLRKILYPEKNFMIPNVEELLLEPYDGFPPLSRKERKKLVRFLKSDNNRIRLERELREVVKKRPRSKN